MWSWGEFFCVIIIELLLFIFVIVGIIGWGFVVNVWWKLFIWFKVSCDVMFIGVFEMLDIVLFLVVNIVNFYCMDLEKYIII